MYTHTGYPFQVSLAIFFCINVEIGTAIDFKSSIGCHFPRDAEEALTFHIQGMFEDGDKLPFSSKLEEIINDPDYADATAFLVITGPEPKPRTVSINITRAEFRACFSLPVFLPNP